MKRIRKIDMNGQGSQTPLGWFWFWSDMVGVHAAWLPSVVGVAVTEKFTSMAAAQVWANDYYKSVVAQKFLENCDDCVAT